MHVHQALVESLQEELADRSPPVEMHANILEAALAHHKLSIPRAAEMLCGANGGAFVTDDDGCGDD